MTQPLVTVVCMCYQQGPYVESAVRSVINQSYSNIQLILVDDGSKDESPRIIKILSEKYPSLEVFLLPENLGYCKAFNKTLPYIKGDFIIDLAADDVLLPHRLEKGVRSFLEHEADYGVSFSDAEWVDREGNHLYYQSDRFPHPSVPQGDIYKELIERYFICPPTMMWKREVMDLLQGYDPNLAYEDFDFWIRSSRTFKYCYVPEVLVKKRVLRSSMSSQQFTRFSWQQQSTFEVCKKIMALNRNSAEKWALSRRVVYEIFQNMKLANVTLCVKYVGLWLRNIFKMY